MTQRPFRSLLVLLALLLSAAAATAAEDQFFDSAGVQIRYTVEGAGDPVVLVHGFTANADSNWRFSGAIGRLAEEFKVIALDARGHGKSGKPHEPSAYGTEMTADVIRLLDHLGIERAHVVGYSMGGFITLKLATEYPDRLHSAVLGGAGWIAPGEDNGMLTLAESLEQGRGVGPLMEALTPAGQPLPTEEQLAAMNQMVLATNDPLALAAVIRGMGDLTVDEETLRALEVPVMAIVGEIDPLKAGVDLLAEVLPSVEVKVLAGKDHMTAVGDPALVDNMREFFIRLCQCA